MRYLIFFILILGVSNLKAQHLNNYKYVIVPEKFEFSKEENQYQLNALAKFLFEKEGFETLMKKDSRPEDLKNDACRGLSLNVENNSGLFSTKFVINLEDCQGNIVFSSKEGYSREKDYKTAWHEAFRDAFESVEELGYSYDGDASVASKPQSDEKEEPEAIEEPEVAKSTPENQQQPSESRGGEVNVSEEAVGGPVALDFEKDGSSYSLEATEKGYQLLHKGSSEPLAVLIKSQNGNSFIYNSLTRQGMAYFTKNGDLVVEHYDAQQGETIKNIYRVKE